MKKINHLVIAVCALLQFTFVFGQEKDYSSLKYSFIQWEESQEAFQDYYFYLNNPETIFKGKDISFLNNQFHDLNMLIEQVDRFVLESQLNPINNDELEAQSLFLKIKSLEVFIEFADVCKQNTKVFNVLNEANISLERSEGDFYKVASVYLSEGYIMELISEWNMLSEKANSLKALDDIKSTYFYNDFLRTSIGTQVSLEVFKTKIKERKQTRYLYMIDEFNNEFIDTSSRLISNFFGFFRIRKGKLYKDIDFLADVKTDIQPLDILLEKTPFRLTDKIIPGYWSHAAVYVGNKEQLIELGIWDDPLVKPHHEAIKNGACIIEALRTNVEINSYQSFSNVDTYAQLRLKKMPSLEVQKEMLLTVFAQIGKQYDFRFNVESSDKMVCTEIHYLAYEMLQFQPTKNLGAYSVSVDDLAAQGASNSLLQPIKLYIEGDKVIEDVQSTYDSLIMSKIEELVSSR